MRKKRIKQFICLFLVSVLLLSGMCSEETEAHSLFPRGSVNMDEEIENIKDHVSCSRSSYFLEISEELTDEAAIEEEEKTRTRSRVSQLFCLIGMPSDHSANLSMTVCSDLYHVPLRDAVIVGYIHQSDGKK